MTRCHQLGLNAGRQGVGAEIDDSGELAQLNAWRPVASGHDRIIDDVEFGG